MTSTKSASTGIRSDGRALRIAGVLALCALVLEWCWSSYRMDMSQNEWHAVDRVLVAVRHRISVTGRTPVSWDECRIDNVTSEDLEVAKRFLEFNFMDHGQQGDVDHFVVAKAGRGWMAEKERMARIRLHAEVIHQILDAKGVK
jgi:hypothetical protein